jgi:hypothetical protein
VFTAPDHEKGMKTKILIVLEVTAGSLLELVLPAKLVELVKQMDSN